jgi:ribosome-binding ATPase
MARLGIVGFANTGKTTLFNALTGLDAATAPHPHSTTEPQLGVARVPDAKLDAAAQVEQSDKLVPATLELLDLPSFGHDPKQPISGRDLGRLREMEAQLVVLRSFDDEAIPAGESGTDPVAQAEELLLELTVADLEVLDRRGQRLEKEAFADRSKKVSAEVVGEAVRMLSEGQPLRSSTWSDGALSLFRDSAPLTLKPAVWAVNTNEDDRSIDAKVEAVQAVVPAGDVVVGLSARLEEEASRLEPEDRLEMFTALGLGQGALSRVVRAAYQSIGLISFYTLGPKEAHAWTVRAEATALEAAGRIHSDLQRGFIRAEISTIDQVISAGGWDAAKKDGLVRVEGKSYRLQEGDVIVVRFSV